jgi:hypothetical protein
MWVRIARSYPVAYTPQILAEYRKHLGSITGKKFITGEYIDDIISAMELNQKYLPEAEKEKVLIRSKRFYAGYIINMANNLWPIAHNISLIHRQIVKALSLHFDYKLLPYIFKIYIKMLIKYK